MEETVERVTPGTRSWEQYGAEHLQRYRQFAELYKNKIVIDAACGTGYGSAYIAEQGAGNVTGIDISEEAILFSQTNYKAPNLSFRLHDCLKIHELGFKADLVISFETLEHLPDPALFIKNVSESLNPGGTFICSTPNKERLSGAGNINPFHPSELSFDEFKETFSRHFTITSIYHQSETVQYLRYQEIKHLLHQQNSQMRAFLYNRIELKLRKLFGKTFQPIQFSRQHLDDLYEEDIYIEPVTRAESWHKTFILTGTKK